MSLITDLLSKIKQQEPERGVPPLLKNSVQQSAAGRRMRNRFAIPIVVILAVAVTGVAAMFFVDYFGRPAKTLTPPRFFAPQTVTPAEVATPATSAQAIAPQSVQPHDPEVISSQSQPIKKEPLPNIVKEDSGKAAAGSSVRIKAPVKKLAQRTAQKTAQSPGDDLKEVKREKASGVSSEEQREKTDKISKQDKDVYLYAARTYESRKDYQQALSNYKKVLTIDPANFMVMNNIASALIQLGAYEEAIRYAEKALKTQKDYIYSLINMGIAYSQLGRFMEGEGYLQRALGMEKSNRNALLNLGLLYENSKAYNKAREIFARLSDTGDGQGYLGLARISEKQGKTSEAVDYYRAAMSVEKRESQIWNFANDRIWQL
ncbi:MAG: tetratricopeptide repeat protein, partial [Deltaproteobacteria bacterium]|nr:tetratricopeptide repeat protein [Deltaproteobacteria bacterium]